MVELISKHADGVSWRAEKQTRESLSLGELARGIASPRCSPARWRKTGMAAPGSSRLLRSSFQVCNLRPPRVTQSGSGARPANEGYETDRQCFVVNARSKQSCPARGLPLVPAGQLASVACCGHDPQPPARPARLQRLQA